MATPILGDVEFLVGACPACAKEVLTHVDLAPDGSEMRLCLHCDGVISPTALETVAGAELEAGGYELIEARLCGNGGGCSSGCGSRARG
jgi:hypothetical protein